MLHLLDRGRDAGLPGRQERPRAERPAQGRQPVRQPGQEGAGAGADVTASGIFADVIRIANK